MKNLPFGLKIGESDVCKESGICTSRYSREQDPETQKDLEEVFVKRNHPYL
jgi:hypothetical protein